MDTREKLTKMLLESDPIKERNFDDEWFDGEIEDIADHLIANGVTIPVRCKDCKHRGSDMCPMETVELYPWFGTKNDAFCSYGERRE